MASNTGAAPVPASDVAGTGTAVLTAVQQVPAQPVMPRSSAEATAPSAVLAVAIAPGTPGDVLSAPATVSRKSLRSIMDRLMLHSTSKPWEFYLQLDQPA